MKTLHVIPDATVNFGGPVMTMSHIMSVLQSLGHTTEAFALERPGKLMPISTSLSRVKPSFPSRFGNSQEALSWFTRRFREFDIVLFHSVWSVFVIRLAQFLREKQRRYAVIPDGSLDPFDLHKKAVAKRILGPLLIRPFLQGSAGVICAAQREADCLVTYGAKCNVITLPWPVPPVPCTINQKEARRHLNLNGKEFVVLSLGRLDYKKGFPVLLPAIKRLAQSGILCRLLIVGPDTRGYGTVVHQMVERLGLNKIVTFLPPVVGEDKHRLMRAADCFALPSLNENFGFATVEAMQQGLPSVISNNIYICRELEEGGAALVCNYDEMEVFAALKQLAENSGLRAKMSAAAIRVARHFEPAVLKERYQAMLEVLAGPKE